MALSLMLIPTSNEVNPSSFTKDLADIFIKNKIDTALIPEFDLYIIESLLAENNLPALLNIVIEQVEKSFQNNSLALIAGLPLIHPYAAQLNFEIATALDAKIIFAGTSSINNQKDIRNLDIISAPYLYRYPKTIIGFILDHKQQLDTNLMQQCQNSSTTNIPFLGCTDSIEITKIKSILDNHTQTKITPAIFKYQLINKAKSANKKIILPEGDEPRTIKAANICVIQKIARCVLLGNKNKINNLCNKMKISLHQDIEIIDPQQVAEKYVPPLFKIRKAKGISTEKVQTMLKDNVVLGTMMVHLNEADGLVSGAIHTTANTIRPAFQIIKTAPNAKLVSSVFFMCLPDQVLVFGDCAINPNPSAEELADIAIQSATSAKAFGIEPKIAMLSYSTGTSGFGPNVDKIKAATKIAKNRQPDLDIEGPIQYDAAISKETAKLKLPDSKVAGKATVFIMPNLDVGNITYKAVQRSTGIVCIGPMLQGLNKPVNDLSRGCSVEDIVFTIAITAMQS